MGPMGLGLGLLPAAAASRGCLSAPGGACRRLWGLLCRPPSWKGLAAASNCRWDAHQPTNVHTTGCRREIVDNSWELLMWSMLEEKILI